MDYWDYSFPSSKYINKKRLIQAHLGFMVPQLMRTGYSTFLSDNDPNKPFPKLSKSSKLGLTRANKLSIEQLLEELDDGPALGKFFLCRVLLETVTMVGMTTVVDDPKGVHALRLSLYDYDRETIPVGTILAIKNPWIKISMDGGLSVRVEDASEVLILDTETLKELNLNFVWEGELPGEGDQTDDGAGHKKQGNVHFAAKDYTKAIGSYSLGIVSTECESTRLELFSNRALAYLHLQKFELALADTNSALGINPNYLKAHYRKVKALFGLKKYAKALEFVTSVSVPVFQKAKISEADKKMLDKLLEEAKLNCEKFKTNGAIKKDI